MVAERDLDKIIQDAGRLVGSGSDASIYLLTETLEALSLVVRDQSIAIRDLNHMVTLHEASILERDRRIEELELHFWIIPDGYKLTGRSGAHGLRWTWEHEAEHWRQAVWFPTEIEARRNLKQWLGEHPDG